MRREVPAPNPFSVASLATYLALTWPGVAVTDPGDGRGVLLVDLPEGASAEALEAAMVAYVHDPAAEALAAAAAWASAERLRLLAASATWAMPDEPEGEERTAWLAYRAQLRDLPQQPGWPAAVAWPPLPA